MTYPLCGHCLHAVSSHEKHNGHFMYCGVCFTLCELSEFDIKHSPTEYVQVVEMQVKREYSPYIPKELKKK